MATKSFTISVHPDEAGYHADVAPIGVTATGATVDQAVDNAEQALVSELVARKKRRSRATPGKRSGQKAS